VRNHAFYSTFAAASAFSVMYVCPHKLYFVSMNDASKQISPDDRRDKQNNTLQALALLQFLSGVEVTAAPLGVRYHGRKRD
jgi:hypothetical protein